MLRGQLCGASRASLRTSAFLLSEMVFSGEHRVTQTDGHILFLFLLTF